MNINIRHLVPKRELFEQLNAALPQTQCTRCGYPDCAAYAQAIVDETAAINQCPPGGAEGVSRLAVISGQPVQPLNEANGKEGPRAVAIIDETWCIGCTLCIKACPTDAIFGSNKLMHTVIESHCTGCELCLPVCPVDCISLEDVTGADTGWSAWSQPQANAALSRYESRQKRHLPNIGVSLKTEAALKDLNAPLNTPPSTPLIVTNNEIERKRAAIEAVMEKVKSRRNNL